MNRQPRVTETFYRATQTNKALINFSMQRCAGPCGRPHRLEQFLPSGIVCVICRRRAGA